MDLHQLRVLPAELLFQISEWYLPLKSVLWLNKLIWYHQRYCSEEPTYCCLWTKTLFLRTISDNQNFSISESDYPELTREIFQLLQQPCPQRHLDMFKLGNYHLTRSLSPG